MQTKSFLPKSRWLVTIILLLSLGISYAWADTYYKKINSLDDVTTGDYVIVGCKTSTDFGLLTYGTLNSNRIPYTKSYSAYGSLPTAITNPAGASVWTLTVTVTNGVKYVTLYNATNSKYIASNASTHDGKYKYDSSSGLSFTIQYESGSYGTFRMFAGSTYYLGVNKSANYWRGYASGTLTATNGLTLYKKAYSVTYNNNGGSGTLTDSNSPYVSGTTVTVKTNSFTAPSGKTFNKWNTKADGSGQDFAESATFTISKDTTFYAQWVSAGTSVSLTNGGCDGSGGTTKGSFTMTQSSSPVTSVTTTSAAQTVDITCTPATGYQTSSVSATNPATLPSAITYGGSADSRTVTDPTGANGSSTITVNFTAISRTVSYSGDTHISSYTTKPTSATIEDEDLTVEYTVESGYAITGVSATIGGAAVDASDMEWDQSSLYILPTDGITGNVAITFTIEELSGYCISAFNSSNNGITSGFSNGGSGNEYTLSYTIPGKDGSSNWPQYWIGENSAYQSYSATANFADMNVTTCNATIGLAQGATGKLHIWDDNKEAGSNLWVKFEPDGYGLRWGGDDWTQAENTKAFTVDAGNSNVYWTEIVTLDGTNNTAWSYYVGLKTASGYVYSGVDNEASDSRGISRTRSVTTMKVSNGTSGSYKATYLNGEATGSRGKFRIWNNNISDYNFYCHWVPFYRVTYNGSGASGSTAASADVCCEGNAAARTVKAAANGFTVPTGKSFGGWASSPENAAAKVVAYAANADVTLTSSITLYAIWNDVDYTVTVNQSPSVGATTTGQTSTAHFNGTINLTTTVPSGYRFVNWTTTDGFSITNNTSATTASFTMPAKNVTVTANFQQTHSISWYVGGTAEGNKLTTGSQTTVVDHGGSITTLPSTPDGSACDKTFQGWTNTTPYTHGTSPLYTTAGAIPAINADASFYAVFATESTSGAAAYKLVEDNGDVTAGNYLIVYNNTNALNTHYGAIGADTYGTYTSISTYYDDDNKAIASNATTDALAYTFTATTGGYTIKHSETIESVATDVYVGCQKDNNTGLRWDDHFCADTSVWVIYKDSINSVKRPTRGIRWNNNKGQERFATYGKTGQQVIQLFKYDSGVTYTGHTLTCASCSNEVTVSFSDPGSGNTMEVAKGLTSISSGDAVKTCSAVELTVTLTPAEHYSVTNLTATGVTGVTTSHVENVYTVSIPADKTGTLTLSPTFTEDEHLAINWSVNGSLLDMSGSAAEGLTWVYSGGKITALPSTPSVPSSCSSKTFAGWSEQNSGTVEKDAMYYGDRFTSAGPKNITSEKTYYAVFATAYDATVDVPHEYDSETFGTSSAVWTADGDQTLNGVSWSLSAEGTSVYFGNDGTKGQQVGSGSYPASELTLSTSDISGTIKSVTITTSGASSINATVGVSVGSTAFLTGESPGSATTAITSSSADYTFTGSAEGEIAISWENSSPKKAIYFKQIVVEYTTEEDGTAYSECITRCCPQYAIALANSGSASGGTFEASASSACEDTEITVSATPSVGYAFSSWDIYKTGASATKITPASSSSAETTFDMPAYGVTVNATFRALAVYTITWKVGDDTWSDKGGSTSVYEGQKVSTLPTAPDPEDFCGDAFIGWTTAENYVHGSSPLYTTASSFPAADGNQTFYAVFADYNE